MATTMLTRKVAQFAFVVCLGMIGFGIVLADDKSAPVQSTTATDKPKPTAVIPSAPTAQAASQTSDSRSPKPLQRPLTAIPPILKTDSGQPNTFVPSTTDHRDGDRVHMVFKIRRAAASDVATALHAFFVNSLGNNDREKLLGAMSCVAEPASNTLLVDTTPEFAADIKRMVEAFDFVPNLDSERVRMVFQIRNVAASDVAKAVNTFFVNSLGVNDREKLSSAMSCVADPPTNTVVVNTMRQFADPITRMIQADDFVPGKNCVGVEVASAPPADMAYAKSPVEQRAEKKAEDLVRQYHQACANGDSEGARLIAREALDLDPACFAKSR
jgi:hypothetical protein